VLRDLLARWGLIVGDVEPNEELCRVAERAERSLEDWSAACKEHIEQRADRARPIPVRHVK
jgi:hypothetical protein